ncbi:tRNA uracil 4-sulfurtransferase ThiI [uncultured Victivallis sp.]|uniref:tRNA uracil 4-sulfurtransferase ThiI n=1 Tax=uncultured Victivallis sp. TaxID=354118 RepID=UPI0025DB3E29|nr:tRNA uracil 4-sulfurtransferase ThiI [uncultured Victivallis sp.]
MYNSIICRYHEIATKGNNRNMFERCLVENIRHLLDGKAPCRVHRVRGRVWVEPKHEGDFTPEELRAIKPQLAKVFGLESFSPAARVAVDMDAIRAKALELAGEVLTPVFAERENISFRVRARRSFKKFPFRSQEIEIDLVTSIAKLFGDDRFRIDLKHAEYTLGVEVRDEFALLYWDEYRAPGGLPVGSNPRVLTLLSGGIDSPVAAWMIMKRGCPTDFITFHSSPYTPPETTDKVRGIAEFLNGWQIHGKLHLCNLAPLQKLIRDNCTERFRTVLYRRAMLRISEQVARATGCRALVTGEAVGQVASQTLVNMNTINRAIDMLVLRPLVGTDKLETIRIAGMIGSYELSNTQVPDSCTVFAPASPATAMPEPVAEAEERKIPDYPSVLEKIIADIETIA